MPIGAPIAVIGEAGETVDLAALGVTRGGGSRLQPSQGRPAKARRRGGCRSRGGRDAASAATAEGVSRLAAVAGPGAAHGRRAGHRPAPGGGQRAGRPHHQARHRGSTLRKDAREGRRRRPAAPPPMPTPSYEPTAGRLPRRAASPACARPSPGAWWRARHQAPHFYITMDVDMAAAMALRAQLNALLPEEREDLGQRL